MQNSPIMNTTTDLKPKSIAFAGGGNMAEAIIAGLVFKAICPPERILACDVLEQRRAALQERYGIRVTADLAELPGFSPTLLLAVKPMHLAEVGPVLQPKLGPGSVVISILAGQSLARLEAALGDAAALVRVMPNLCSRVGAGISAITFPEKISDPGKDWVKEILSSVGATVEVQEPLQDAVTAVSGSGPGYIFYLAGHFIAAAEKEGLAPDVARRLVVETLYGSARVLQDIDEDCMDLVRKVATPGGTTEAGLSALADGKMPDVLAEMVHRATSRSQELGKG